MLDTFPRMEALARFPVRCAGCRISAIVAKDEGGSESIIINASRHLLHAACTSLGGVDRSSTLLTNIYFSLVLMNFFSLDRSHLLYLTQRIMIAHILAVRNWLANWLSGRTICRALKQVLKFFFPGGVRK